MTEREIQHYTELGYHFQDVYSIFVYHFGEDRVDIQDIPLNIETAEQSFNVYILVHFPVVTVTNENGKSTTIRDLFARVQVKANGRLENQFELTKATYTKQQFYSGYVHSHLPSYLFCLWSTSCLGRGPIQHTISRLLLQYDECTWMLFCRELDEYVHVESLTGGPYIRLETIGGYTPARFHVSLNRNRFDFPKTYNIYESPTYKKKILEFTQYLLQNCHYKFCWSHGEYQLAYSALDFAFLITKYFTDFLRITGYQNKEFLDKGFVKKYILKDGNLYKTQRYTRERSLEDYIGRQVCVFKGRPYNLRVVGESNEEVEDNKVFVLECNFVNFIYQLIVNIINYTYGRKLNQGTTVI